MSNIYIPESAIAIVAHPDDIEFSCAGTLASWAQSGARIKYILCTSGDSGIDDPNITREKAAEIRENEQQEAAKIIGVQDVIFLREPDGLLQPTIELRKTLIKEIRKFRPEVVICGDPTIVWVGNDYINHPDHRAAATAALDATFPASGQINLFREFEELGIYAHKPRKVFVTSWRDADFYVGIEDTIELKIQALRAHKSQMRDWDPEESIRKWARERGEGKEMAYAEGFRVVTLIDDETWEKTKGAVNVE